VNLFTKEELIEKIKIIAQKGWIKSVKSTSNTRNDGAVGNTLEFLLGIEENNLPIPNANDWELKGQRENTSSLITLKHIEPSPQGSKIVSNLLLPKYGWKHKEAGNKYPKDELSFRSTTYASSYTKRGFKIIVDRSLEKIRFIFNYKEADINYKEIKQWLKRVKSKAGLGELIPEPYWGFNDLKRQIGEKIKNCFYVVAESKKEKGHEYFAYKKLIVLSGFSFEGFLSCVENNIIFVDFDARTGHNHGTKFRIKQGYWKNLYSDVKEIML
jgi:hypothetical protein